MNVIVLPTYNERENLRHALARIREVAEGCGVRLHTLIVDDNSPDGTGELADELALEVADVSVMHRAGKEGLGKAYIAGFREALERGAERVFEMDADLSHDASYLPHFLRLIDQGADLVLGSRYVKGGGVENWGLSRKVISRGGCLYAQTILGLPYRDLTGGFKCFRRRVLETIDLDRIDTAGYGFQIEMTYRTHQLGFKIVELPIIFVDRKVGESKMSNDIVLEAMTNVWKLRFEQGAGAAAGVSGGAEGAASSGRTSGASRPESASRGRGTRILAVDVGAGTADILLTRPGQPLENAVKLVVPSRTQVVAAQIAEATRRGQTVVFSGPTMGGGADGAAMKAHLGAGHAFVATEEAARTFADDVDKVRALGARVVGEGVATELLGRLPAGSRANLRSGDLDASGLRDALAMLGVEPRFDAVAVAVQDHGFSPRSSNRVFRFAFWRAAVDEGRLLGDLFYDAAAAPADFTRLRAAAALAQELAGGGPALVADTGPAALYGALPEGLADAVLVNAGNGHTICVVTLGGRLAGVFEHHTRLLDGPGLERYLRRFLAGELDGDEVRADGGHGAVLAAAAKNVERTALPFYATGPRRALLAGSELPLEFAAPHGDMMLTGCFGLLRAFAERGVTPDGRR